MNIPKRKVFFLFFLAVALFFNVKLRVQEVGRLDVSKPSLLGMEFKVLSKPRARYGKASFLVEAKGLGSKKLSSKKFWVKTSAYKGFERGDVLKLSERSDKRSFEFLESEESTLQLFIKKLQYKIKAFYYRYLSKKDAGIVTSLLLGSRVAEIDRDFIRQARNLGLGHFFAASGFHVLLLVLFLSWFSKYCLGFFFREQEVRRIKITDLLTVIAVLLYSALAGFSPSVIRAAMLFLGYYGFKLLGRKIKTLKFLFVLALINILIDPYLFFDIGFQFSYMATAAILVWASKLRESLMRIKIADKPLPSYILDIISVSLAVQIFLLSLVVYYFGNLQVWSLPANIVFTPILSLVLVLSFLGLYFLIEPLLTLTKFIFALSQSLPLIDYRLEFSFLSCLLLFVIFNLVAYIVTHKPKCRIVYISSAFSLLLILLALNIKPIAYQNLRESSSQALLIEQRDSIDSLKLRDSDILLLPKLSSKDLYFDTLLKAVKPKLILYSLPRKLSRSSKRARENIQVLESYASNNKVLLIREEDKDNNYQAIYINEQEVLVKKNF